MKKYALHFGLDKPSYHIQEDNLKSNSSVLNTKYYHKLSKKLGFNSRIRTNENATSYSLIRNLTKFSKELEAGDFLFITYCGHGTCVAANSEFDGASEILILYDRLLLDTEFAKCLSRFKDGVYIFIVTNSCLNGTLFEKKKISLHEHLKLKVVSDANKSIASISEEPKAKKMQNDNEEKNDTVEDNDELQENYISGHQYANYLNAIKYYLKEHKQLTIPIIHIASSSDSELSNDGEPKTKSEFTIAFETILEKGLNITYSDLFNELYLMLDNPRPHLEINSNCRSINDFLHSEIFKTPEN